MTTNLPRQDATGDGRRPPLNYYGRLVQHQWEGCLPEIYQ